MTTHSQSHIAPRTKGFTLIEVVLAIGIFLLSILALVGLLGPTLSSVEDVTQADEVTSVVNTVNAFLMNSPDIAPDGSRFNRIYDALRSGNNGVLTMFVFREFFGDGASERLRVGFSNTVNFASDNEPEPIREAARINLSDFGNAAGPIYRVLLSISTVTPTEHKTDEGVDLPRYTLNKPLASYPEGYLAMEVRIFTESSQPPPDLTSDLTTLANRQPIFTYNMAIVR